MEPSPSNVETSFYMYDLGSQAGLVIRELAPSIDAGGMLA